MTYTGFDAFHRPTSRTITYPNGNTETVSLTFDHEGENTLVVAGATVVEAAGYNEMGQLKRLALGNGLTTWLGYHGYEGSSNNDAYDAKEVTWGGGLAAISAGSGAAAPPLMPTRAARQPTKIWL